jgi:hypothetical protein
LVAVPIAIPHFYQDIQLSAACLPTMAEFSEKTAPNASIPTTEASERDDALIGPGDSDASDAPGYTNGITLAIVLIADLLAVFLVVTTHSGE